MFVTLAVLGSALGVNAQTMKPGLWEISHKMQGGSGDLGAKMAAAQEQMAKMPPEQRKMMEDMMAKQGVTMGAGGPAGGMTLKICMTKEMAERDEVPAGQGDCTSTKSPRVGNTMKIAFTCTKPPSSGEGQITFNGSDAYAMKMTVNTAVKGQPQKMDMESSGKFLGADCGAIKPIALPKK
jgi:hypothetical protein